MTAAVDSPVKAAMSRERAKEIVSACVAHSMLHMGLADSPPPSLDGISLGEMVEANHIIGAARAEPMPDGTTMHLFTCDDRFLAALYACYHYPACAPSEAESVAITRDGTRGLFVIRIPKAPEIGGDL